MFTTAPPPRAFMCGWQSFDRYQAARRLRSSVACHSSGVTL